MTEATEERRRRRAGLFLGLLALLVIGLVAGLTASLATGASTPPLRVNSTPSTVVLTAGADATYAVRLTRGSERGAVAFSVADLPPAATATFSPASTTGDTSTLTITTDGDSTDGTVTPAGDYDIVLRATGPDAVAGAIVRLKVQSAAMPGTNDLVRVSGTLGTVLRPGAGAGLNLSLTNPSGSAVRLSSVNVSLASLSAPRANTARPCTLADFEVLPYGGPAITLTPGQTRTLAQLDVPAAQWPQVRMRNTSVNQDGCQDSTVSFSYGVTGRTA